MVNPHITWKPAQKNQSQKAKKSFREVEPSQIALRVPVKKKNWMMCTNFGKG